jgi:hypothetical protein
MTMRLSKNAKRTLPDATRESILEHHIPDRVREVIMCAEAAKFGYEYGRKHDGMVKFGSIRTLATNDVGWIIDPFLDTGIIMCRALFEFIGIDLSQSDDLYIRTKPRFSSDVCLEHFLPSYITLNEGLSRYADTSEGDLEEAIRRTIRAGDKGIGHLTKDPARQTLDNLRHLELSCKQIVNLLKSHLYLPLDRPLSVLGELMCS